MYSSELGQESDVYLLDTTMFFLTKFDHEKTTEKGSVGGVLVVFILNN